MRSISFGLILMVIASTGCAASPLLHARITVAQSKQLRIGQVSVKDLGSSILVRGRVARRSIIAAPTWGHLHIEAWAEGRRLACKDARWLQLSKRRVPTSAFHAKLPIPPSEIDEIRIVHAAVLHREQCQ